MTSYEIVFKLNDEEKIIIELEEPLYLVDCCYQEYINFYRNKKKICSFSTDTIRYNLSELSFLLTQALKNELYLDSSITKNIGYLANEDDQNKPGLIYHNKTWVGRKYALFGGILDEKTYLYSWIYNDTANNIIFEITPKYKWHFLDPENAKNNKDYIPYDEWIKNYKPILTRTIPREIAQQWLDQANSILTKIEENTTRIQAQEDND